MGSIFMIMELGDSSIPDLRNNLTVNAPKACNTMQYLGIKLKSNS